MSALDRVLTVVSVVVVLSSGVVGCESAQPPTGKGNLPPQQKADIDAMPQESPDAKVLDKLLGAWGPSNNNFKAMEARWAFGGTYVRVDKHFNDEAELDTTCLIAWDKEKKVYRCWQFSRLDGGSPEQGEGTWDDKSNTLTFTCAPHTDGSVLVISYAVSGDGLTYKEGPRDESPEVSKLGMTCDWSKRK